MSGVPLTVSSGLGVWSVSGRMRMPRPAASTMALAVDRVVVSAGMASPIMGGTPPR